MPGESIGYTPSVVTSAPAFKFKDKIDGMGGEVADLDDHDTRMKEHDQKRKANQTLAMMNESMYS